MPDAVRLTTVEIRFVERGFERRLECRFRNVAWATLLYERDPVFGEIVVRAVRRAGECLAAEESHRQVLGDRLQLDFLIAQAQTKRVALIAVSSDDVQTIRHHC